MLLFQGPAHPRWTRQTRPALYGKRESQCGEATNSQIYFFFFPHYGAWNKAKNIGLESLSRQLIIAKRQFVKQERLLICKSSSILIVSFKLKEVELIKIDLKQKILI